MKSTLKTAMALALPAILLVGCAKPVNKELVPTGGSKADGVVELSYTYDPIYENPIIDEAQGDKNATARCVSWGYTAAEAFGGSVVDCNLMDSYGTCRMWYVTKKYQCTN